MLKQLVAKFKGEKPATLRINRADETQGGLLLGDTGTGKTQWLHQSIRHARGEERREPGVCYDPAGEFSQVHFRAKTDVILNPLNERFPNWQLRWEVEDALDADLIAESFFTTQYVSEAQKFFNGAAKGIFKLLLLSKVSNQKMVKVLSDENLIDELVKGTELALKISAKAGPQRAAVLGTLADVADVLRLIPANDKEKKDLSLSHWAKNKSTGWLFLTSTLDTRSALRPLQAAMLNILMMRLMSVPAQTGKASSFWFIADELHSLHTLSALPTFVYESRKFGAKYIFGTQSKHQIIKYYGTEAPAILASPSLKVFLRCNESETAQWISENIGNEERVMPFTSASVDADGSRGVSTSYSNRTEKRIVVSKEQVMQLPNMHGYWCYTGRVVPFALPYIDWHKNYPAFIPRKRQPAQENKPKVPSAAATGRSNANPVKSVCTAETEKFVASPGNHPPEVEKPNFGSVPENKSSEIDLDF